MLTLLTLLTLLIDIVDIVGMLTLLTLLTYTASGVLSVWLVIITNPLPLTIGESPTEMQARSS